MKTETLPHILQDRFGIPPDIIADAQQTAQKSSEPLKDILVRKKIVSENLLLKALELQYGIPYHENLHVQNADTDFTSAVPISFLKKYHIVPIINNKGTPPSSSARTIIAANDPACLQAIDDLAALLGIETYQLVLSTRGEILSSINNFYDQESDSAQKIVDDMEDNEGILTEISETSDLLDDPGDAPIIKLVNHIISQSVKAKASDIHIEPSSNRLKVRYRIDGILYDLLEPPNWIQSSLITRIKVMANMDIAEKRLPQDSRIEVRIGNKDIDIRISTIPTALGERIVLRLLDKSSSLLKLSEFGIKPKTLDLIRQLSSLPNGIILMTGPTGSGKTTTLYAMLSEINKPDVNIITVEDPVEYKLQGVNQMQVNSKIGLTFAKSLRSIVRQDPDVILIGEIRDHETSSIAVQSSLTGHLVLSTLHTNDSASAITRLVDIGIEPFLITSAVRAVIAQRLIRILCPNCKEEYTPDPIALERIGLAEDDCIEKTFHRAKGCDQCFQTGYKGRMPIFEIMVLAGPLKSLIVKTSDSSEIKNLAVQNNMTTLLQDGVEKIFDGITTIEEVLRVTQI